MRILLVEDEKKLNTLIMKKLTKEGFCVDCAYDGQEAKDFFPGAEYDVVILDVMLPGINGYELLKYMRSEKITAPVLFLTARDGVDDIVYGLNCGADDYLTKPFSFEELLARIRVLIRRANGSCENTLSISDLVLNPDTRQVSRAGNSIELAGKEFAILEYMLRNKGKVLSRDKISQHVWNYSYEGGSNLVDVYIRYLRKKCDEGYSQKLIHTVRGAGYVIKEEK